MPPRTLAAMVAGGISVPGEGLQAIGHVSPRDAREEMWRVPLCTATQAALAAAEARRALSAWVRKPKQHRIELAQNLAGLVEKQTHALASQITVEIGKPVNDARREVMFAADLLRAAARAAAAL